MIGPKSTRNGTRQKLRQFLLILLLKDKNTTRYFILIPVQIIYKWLQSIIGHSRIQYDELSTVNTAIMMNFECHTAMAASQEEANFIHIINSASQLSPMGIQL